MPTHSETEAIALLIEERDEILENLEIAEARYINSFRLTTPDPSLADWEPRVPEDPSRPYISRPKPLGLGKAVRKCSNNASNTLKFFF